VEKVSAMNTITMIIYKTKLSSKGQLVIPKEIRDKLHITKHTPLTISMSSDQEIRISTAPALKTMRGFLKPQGKTEKTLTKQEMEDIVAQAIIEGYF